MSAGGSEGEWAELSGVGAARAGVDEGRSDTGAAEPPSGDLFQAPFLPGVYVGSVLSTWGHPLSSPSAAPNPSQHQGLFQ